jgi:hypothetical protein
MGWKEFFLKFSDTAGITLLFAALGSGFALWAQSNRAPPKPITSGAALMVVAAGQIVGAVATAFCYGYLGWSLFTAPAVGAFCGLAGIAILMTGLKVGYRIEERGGDIADKAIDTVTNKKGT